MPAEGKEDRSRAVTVLQIPVDARQKSSPRSRQASSIMPGAWAINPMAQLDSDDYADAFEEAAREDGDFADALQSAALDRKELDPRFDLVLDACLADNKWPISLTTASESSLMSQILTQPLFEKLKTKKSAVAGWTLARAINSGVLYPGGVGIFAADLDCYNGTFRQVFEPMVEAYHIGFKVREHQHNPDINLDGLASTVVSNAVQAKVVSARWSVVRNLSFVPLNPGGTKESRLQVESTMTQVFANLSGEFAGVYMSHNAMTDVQKEEFSTEQLLPIGGDVRLAASGIHEFWPTGRGIFHNHNKTFFVWVNHSDHLVIFTVARSCNVLSSARLMFEGLATIEAELKRVTSRTDVFLMDRVLGSISCCPSNLGSGFCGSVRIRAPLLARRPNLDSGQWCIAKLCGESEVMDCIELSNTRRLGVSVNDSLNDIMFAVNLLVQLEDDFLSPKSITIDVIPPNDSMLIARFRVGACCTACKTLVPFLSTGLITCSACQVEFQAGKEKRVLECPYCLVWSAGDSATSTMTCAVCTSTSRVEQESPTKLPDTTLNESQLGYKRAEQGSSFVCSLMWVFAVFCSPVYLLHVLVGMLVYFLAFIPVWLSSCGQPATSPKVVVSNKSGASDWAQICRKQGMRALWGLSVANCTQWWLNKLFITNFCMFSRKQAEYKYVIRMPQGIDGFQALVEKCFVASQHGGFTNHQQLQLVFTTKGRVAARTANGWVVLGSITRCSSEGLQVCLKSSHVLGPALLSLNFAPEAVTLTLNIEYALNSVSLSVLAAARREVAALATQLEAYLQQVHWASPPLPIPSSAVSDPLYVPLSHTVLPFDVEDNAASSSCCGQFLSSVCVWPCVFLLCSLPYLIVHMLWWLLKFLYVFFGLILTSICWCHSPTPTLLQTPRGMKVQPRSVPWSVRLDVLVSLEFALIARKAFGWAKAYAQLVAAEPPPAISDQALRRLLTSSAAAHQLVFDSGASTYRITCGNTNGYCDLNGTLARIEVGQVNHSPQDPSWSDAKFQLTGNIVSKLLQQYDSRSDLMFPQLAATSLLCEVRPGSVLFYLLAPHLRFVLNMDSVRDSCYGGCLPFSRSRAIESPLNDEKDSSKVAESPRQEWPSNFLLPHLQTHPTNYDKFLWAYYCVIRQFVASVYPDIKAERSYPPFMATLAQILPPVLTLGAVDLLSILIWQVSVVHSAERVALRQFTKYCGLTSDGKCRSGREVVRARSFVDVFVGSTAAKLMECDYEFPSTRLRVCQLAFRQALREVDLDLLERGIRLVPLDDLRYCISS